MKTLKSTLLTLMSSAALLAACSAEPTAEDYDDVAASVAAVVADGAGSEVEASSDAVLAAQGSLPSGMTRSGAGQLVGRRGQLDYAFEVTCQDAAGATQAACEAGVTDTAHLVLDWDGVVDTARWDADLSRHGDWTLSGLTTETATLEGHGTFDVDATFAALHRPVERSFVLAYDADYDAVQLRTADRRPVGGRIRYAIHAERVSSRGARQAERSFDVTAEVTFAPDAPAVITLDGVRTYHVDLATGAVSAAE
jgi:hypothetical protein